MRLAGLDHPCFAGLGLAHGLGVDAGSLAHPGLGEPAGAVVVQLPVVLQHPDLAGQGQQPLGVRALVHDDPAGAGGQQPGGLAVVAQAFDGLGGDDDLDADVADPLGQVDGVSTPEARAENSSRTSRASSPSRGLRPVA